MPAKRIFRRQGKKIIVSPDPPVKLRKGKLVTRCNKEGSLFRPEGSSAWIDLQTGRPTYFQTSMHVSELKLSERYTVLKKSGVQGVIDLNRAMYLAGRFVSRQSQQVTTAELQEIIGLINAIMAKPRLRFLLEGITVTEKTTLVQLRAMQKMLDKRIVQK